MKFSLALTILLGFAILVVIWRFGVAPRLLALPEDFSYSAGVESFDNFYDEEKGDFQGEERTVTQFSYKVIGQPTPVMLEIKNEFVVQTVYGDPVFSVERIYGVDRMTGKLVPGYGDNNREGNLFAPRGLKEGDRYTYWHVNYDAPAKMEFVGEDEIEGLRVFHYKSVGLKADQTYNLTFLPGVGETRGVILDVDLQTWVEPNSGYLVKYEDRTLASFYDLATGEVLHPWNKFHNRYSESTIRQHAHLASRHRLRTRLILLGLP